MIAPEEEYLVKYYQKFGFVNFNYINEISVENIFKRNFNIKIANLDDSQEIDNLFQKYTIQYKISQHRDLQFTIERLKEVFAENGKIFILSRNNKNYGYFIYEGGIITECINLLEDEENEKIEQIRKILENKDLGYILDCKPINMDSIIDINNNKNKIPYSLIRIITPTNFVKKYLDFIEFGDKDDFNKNLIIKDDILGDSSFNIKKVNQKKIFSIIPDKNAVNIEMTVIDLMKEIILNFVNNSSSYIIQDKFFFTEKW